MTAPLRLILDGDALVANWRWLAARQPGAACGAAVKADCTISFVALKTGLFLDAGPEHAGRLLFDDLGVGVPDEARFRPVLERLSEADVLRALPPRPHAANKGDFGRVLIVGGGPGMPGAARMAGEACLRAGANVHYQVYSDKRDWFPL